MNLNEHAAKIESAILSVSYECERVLLNVAVSDVLWYVDDRGGQDDHG